MILFSVTALLCTACEVLGPEIIEQASQQPGGSKHLVKMIASPIPYADATKTTMTVNASGLQFNWSSGDKAGVYSSAGGFTLFSLTGGAGTNTATFDGSGFDLTDGASYYAFYPYNGMATDNTAIPLDYSSQTITADNDIVSPLTKDYMWAGATAAGGTASFAFNHVGSFVRLQMSGFPQGYSVSKVQIIPMYHPIVDKATFDITSENNYVASPSPAITATESVLCREITATSAVVPESGTSTLWAMMAPQDFSDDAFAVVATVSGIQCSARLSGTNQKAGKAYQWNVAPVVPTLIPNIGFSDVQVKDQVEMSVTPGNYSGITYLQPGTVSGTYKFAVVDDKLGGGGIVFFTIPISSDGEVDGANIVLETPAGTTGESVRDNEDIVAVGTDLWVAAEDQSIRKYAVADGAGGTVQFTIPADMQTSCITPNAGFEALAYNAATGKFWTTTELPLKKDTFLPRLHRLQRFDADGQPDARYLYQMDEPTKSAAEAAAAKSYVFGIPAITALDDGRLFVLEREVYVPSSLSQIVSDTFAKVKIYVVDPLHDEAGILRKSLLTAFQTGVEDIVVTSYNPPAGYISASLANYEGMCLGPDFGDYHSLILIADSQGGSPQSYMSMSMNLTKEWIKVILFK